MQNQSFDQIKIHYRPYNFPVNFPVISFTGDNWIVSMTTPLFFHLHNCIEIGFCISGSGSLYMNNNVIPYEKGNFSIIYPNAPHMHTSNGEPSKWEYIYFDPQLLLKSLNQNTDKLCQSLLIYQKSPGIVKAEKFPLLCHLLENILLEFHRKETLYQDAINGLLLSTIPLFQQASSDIYDLPCELHSINILQDALLYIGENYAKSISITYLAKLCCISESHLRRIFKTVTGYSPLEYIHHYRIRQACHSIYKNHDTLNNIARFVGYTTLSSFNRQFLLCMHMSPSEWKKSCMNLLNQNEVTSYEALNTQHIFML